LDAYLQRKDGEEKKMEAEQMKAKKKGRGRKK
jgi:hypothetical protein